MLLNVSQDFSEKRKLIQQEVGKPLTLEERKQVGGSTLSGLPIIGSSIEIYNLLTVNNQENTCSIEIRSKGIVISFRSNHDTFSLVIPFYKLKVYKGGTQEYSFYKDHYFIKIWPGGHEQAPAFLKQILKMKSDTAHTRVDDLP